jgi:hypothetical protein
MLTCCRCGQSKDETEFYSDSSKARGYSYRCKQCNKGNERRYRQNNQDKIKAHRKTYVYNRKKEANAVYYKKHCIKIKRRVAEYRVSRRKTDPYFRAMESLRCRTGAAYRAVKANKPNKTSELVKHASISASSSLILFGVILPPVLIFHSLNS